MRQSQISTQFLHPKLKVRNSKITSLSSPVLPKPNLKQSMKLPTLVVKSDHDASNHKFPHILKPPVSPNTKITPRHSQPSRLQFKPVTHFLSPKGRRFLSVNASDNFFTKLRPELEITSIKMQGVSLKPQIKAESINQSVKELPSTKVAEIKINDTASDSSYSSEEFDVEIKTSDHSPKVRISEKFNSPFIRKQTTKKSTVGSLISEHYLHNLASIRTSSLRREGTIEDLLEEINTTSNVIVYNDLKLKLADKDPLLEGVHGNMMKWKVVEVIGNGSFGQVMKVIEVFTGKIFAVKRLFYNPNNEIQQKFINELSQEISVLQTLKSKRIVKYIGSEVLNDNYCMYLEYLPGGSLAKLLYKLGGLPESTVGAITRQILKGIVYLHENGIVHRDLKCENILLDSNGEVKVCDFGCSKKYENEVNESGIIESLKGSLPWMAPEVIKQAGYGRKADIWSLGCIIIEMLTAKPPWSDTDNQLMLMMRVAVMNETPSIPVTSSEPCRDFLKKCLHRDPNIRPSANALLSHPFVQKSQINSQ